LTTDQPPLRAVVDGYGIGLAVPRRGADPHDVAAKIRLLAGNVELFRRNLQKFCNDHCWADEAAELVMIVSGPKPAAERRLRKAG